MLRCYLPRPTTRIANIFSCNKLLYGVRYDYLHTAILQETREVICYRVRYD